MVSELKGKLLALRFENATGQLKEFHLIAETRRDIARIFTAIKQNKNNDPIVKERVAFEKAPKAAKVAEGTETVATPEPTTAPIVAEPGKKLTSAEKQVAKALAAEEELKKEEAK